MVGGATAKPNTGFTLVEMLVVLAIMAIMAGAVVLSLGAGGQGLVVETEARRLADHLRLAADETLVTDRALALDWDERGYGFVSRDPETGGWRADRQPALGTRHELPGALSLDGPRSGLHPIAFDTVAPPADFVIASRSSRWRVRWDGMNADVLAIGEG